MSHENDVPQAEPLHLVHDALDMGPLPRRHPLFLGEPGQRQRVYLMPPARSSSATSSHAQAPSRTPATKMNQVMPAP
ncbi:hypothetical protein RKD28_006802 [Streptomyces sp. SAI-229]